MLYVSIMYCKVTLVVGTWGTSRAERNARLMSTAELAAQVKTTASCGVTPSVMMSGTVGVGVAAGGAGAAS